MARASAVKSTRGIWRSVLHGVGAAATAQLIAFMLMAAGHGWLQPFIFSAAIWIMLPGMMVRLRQHRLSRKQHFLPDMMVLLAASLLDLMLAILTIRDDEPVFLTLGSATATHGKVDWGLVPFTLAWIGLWLSWQVAAGFLLVSRIREAISREKA